MKSRQLIWLTMACVVFALTNALLAFSDDISANAGANQPLGATPAKNGELSIDTARDRATVTQDIYAATLRMLHDRYFHQDKRILPARAMQDIFSDIERQANVKTRWISASLKPMSIDHTPETEFEKQAAKEIAAGTPHFELVQDGTYHRAIAIPLTGGCLSCHEGLFQNNGRKKFAGLVISIPLRGDNNEPESDSDTPE